MEDKGRRVQKFSFLWMPKGSDERDMVGKIYLHSHRVAYKESAEQQMLIFHHW